MSQTPGNEPTRQRDDEDDDVPPIDFTTFVMSLVTTANLNLEDREQGRDEVASYAMACQTLDLLKLLEEKTQGNLSGEEERVLVDLIDHLDGRCRACGPSAS